MNYKGVIVEESLSDTSILSSIEILNQSIEKVSDRDGTPWLEKWTIDTVLISEEKIEELTTKLSELIDTEHCNDWFCDFKNDKYHYIVFSNKVFKLNRNNKEDYKKMQEYAYKIGLNENNMPRYNDLPTNLLIGFLTYAKKQTYANSSAERLASSRLGSNDYHYEEEIEGEMMTYHDTYFGTTNFIGEEVVYRGSENPKWGMNYYGQTLDETLTEEIMDKVLRKALILVGEDEKVLPLRGPSKLEIGEFTYTFETIGTMEKFRGIERIYKDSKLIFCLHCHGGIIE